jgi:class 3 adenylate cyclase
MRQMPETRYAKTPDGVYIAFQVFGQGPYDLLFVPGFFSNLIANWEVPGIARFLERLSSFARVIAMDRRGIGLSDRMSPGELPPLETQMDDLLAVLDAVHVRRAHLVGNEEGGALCALLAASYPNHVESLTVYAMSPRMTRIDDFPYGPTPEEWAERSAARISLWARGWGRDAAREDYEFAAPSAATDEGELALWARYLMLSASPGSAISTLDPSADPDIRAVLPTIRVPTLVLTREDTPRDHPAKAKWVSESIPGARLVQLPGRDLAFWVGDTDAMADEIEAFVTGVRPRSSTHTLLATVLFTDIVGSTQHQASLGDAEWKKVIQRHHAVTREELLSHRGVEVETTGDGFYATFDGPARAIRCALAVAAAMRPLGIEVRAGLHTGECELLDGKASGLTVSIGARVAASAGPSEVLVSQTVKDLVAGSGLRFEDRGVHQLKGVPGKWRLYAAWEV